MPAYVSIRRHIERKARYYIYSKKKKGKIPVGAAENVRRCWRKKKGENTCSAEYVRRRIERQARSYKYMY